ncbi:tripartite tricarboxylate transporter TctB family protein [Methylopila turkensis]|uniref:tripartite tricarboxylate transporter TctB family protein n=1 Tax=Methylopila turkensis TaxID=1437816 RepID=UPI0022F33716|nr:tripartite tricarboxylate transporter TctB family protein [Methylopila turkensis]
MNTRDAAAGGIFIAIAAAFALGTMDLTIGTALRMGPGYFPLLLAGVLGLLGVIILLKSFGRPSVEIGTVPWRGAALILISPIVFGLTIRWLGLAPSVALVVAISAFASRRSTVKLAVALTLALTLFCVIVFQRWLGLPIPVFNGPFAPLNPYFDMAYAPFGAAFSAIGSALAGVVAALRGLFGA